MTPVAAAPSGYAYRYHDGLRFNDGQEVNGGKPIESIPYWLGAAPSSDELPPPPLPSDEAIARLFHDTYERLAPRYGYVTREESRAFDPETANGRLMIAVCGIVARSIIEGPRQ